MRKIKTESDFALDYLGHYVGTVAPLPLTTKIIATLGPVSSKPAILKKLAQSVDIFRLNMSHGDHASHQEVIQAIRSLSNPPEIMFDLQGPKLRVGRMPKKGIDLKRGCKFTLTTEDILGHESHIPIQLLGSLTAIKLGDRIFFDDGLIETIVLTGSETELVVQVIVGGNLKEKKGMNFPDSILDIPALTEKDYADVRFAVEQGADYLALSFVRQASDIEALQAYLPDLDKPIPIIAKIEKPEAITNIDEIIAVSDGIMVARGDLAVEVHFAQVPRYQKKIVRKCRLQKKPVIVATQTLGSMEHNPRPTRAEASDVANAIYDGANSVMLSGETAVGDYPIEAVQAIAAVIASTEQHIAEEPIWAKFDSWIPNIWPKLSQSVQYVRSWYAPTNELPSLPLGPSQKKLKSPYPIYPDFF